MAMLTSHSIPHVSDLWTHVRVQRIILRVYVCVTSLLHFVGLFTWVCIAMYLD